MLPTGWASGNCASTDGSDTRPWLFLDLGGADLVWYLQLTLHFAAGECVVFWMIVLAANMLRGATLTHHQRGLFAEVEVRVGNTLPTAGLAAGASITANTLCGSPSLAADVQSTIDCTNAPVSGRYVSIQVGACSPMCPCRLLLRASLAGHSGCWTLAALRRQWLFAGKDRPIGPEAGGVRGWGVWSENG